MFFAGAPADSQEFGHEELLRVGQPIETGDNSDGNGIFQANLPGVPRHEYSPRRYRQCDLVSTK
jgi:hypothetical protein